MLRISIGFNPGLFISFLMHVKIKICDPQKIPVHVLINNSNTILLLLDIIKIAFELITDSIFL